MNNWRALPLFSVSLSISLSPRCHSSTASSGRDIPPPSCPVSTCCRLSAGKTAAGTREQLLVRLKLRQQSDGRGWSSFHPRLLTVFLALLMKRFCEREEKRNKERKSVFMFDFKAFLSCLCSLKSWVRPQNEDKWNYSRIRRRKLLFMSFRGIKCWLQTNSTPFYMILAPFQNHFGALNFFCEEIKTWI